VTRVWNPDGTSKWWNYGDQEWVTGFVDENAHVWHYQYDGFGRTVKTIEFKGTCTGTCVPTSYSQVNYAYDVADRLRYVTPRNPQTLDPQGNPVAVAPTTEIRYDLMGRKTYLNDPDMGIWNYVYDASGNLTRQTDARGQRVCSYYDAHNNLFGKDYPGTNACPTNVVSADDTRLATRYYYFETGVTNGRGRRTRMVDSSGSTTWRYDARGRVTEETKNIAWTSTTGSDTFKTQWGYDSMNRVRTMRYPANNTGGLGETVTYSYYQDSGSPHYGLVAELGSVSGEGGVLYASSLRYNEHKQLTRVSYGNGVTQRFGYHPLTQPNGRGRLSYITAGTDATNYWNRMNVGMNFDHVGNVQTIVNYNDYKAPTGTEPPYQTQNFTYDEQNRLRTAEAVGGNYGRFAKETYGYDLMGNILSQPGKTYQYGTQASDCPTASLSNPHSVVSVTYTSTSSWSEYCYDLNGNRERSAEKGLLISTEHYTYDAENRLTEVERNRSVVASYVYDGDGNRVKSTQGATTTAYVGSHVEWSGTTLTKYYYAGSQRIATRRGSTLTYLLSDHLGSTSLLLDTAGNRVGETRYKPWGQERYSFMASGTSQPSRKFTGQIYDGSAELYFYNARYYDPSIGRFIQPDTVVPGSMPLTISPNDNVAAGLFFAPNKPENRLPSSPQNLNRYSYANNNPLTYTDPSGHVALPLASLAMLRLLGIVVVASAVAGVVIIAGIAFVGYIQDGIVYVESSDYDEAAKAAGIKPNEADNEGTGRVYDADNRKHGEGGWGTEMDLDPETAQEVLDGAIADPNNPNSNKLYGYHDGKIYVFVPDNAGKYHGYPVEGNEVPNSVLRDMRKRGVITNREYERLRKGK
jgi:RHS repeat-associated protein